VVSFTTRPLYTWGKSPWYQLNRRLGGQYGQYGDEKILDLTGTRIRYRASGQNSKTALLLLLLAAAAAVVVVVVVRVVVVVPRGTLYPHLSA
jgi:hypothetical protein